MCNPAWTESRSNILEAALSMYPAGGFESTLWILWILSSCLTVEGLSWCQPFGGSCIGRQHRFEKKTKGDKYLHGKTPWINVTSSIQVESVAFADWDYDGDLDFLLLTQSEIIFYERLTEESFVPHHLMAVEDQNLKGLAVLDWNGDGNLDLLFCSWENESATVSWLPGTKTRILTANASEASCVLQPVDFDEDGDIDLILGQRFFERISEDKFTERFGTQNPLEVFKGKVHRVADVDADGHLDVLVEGWEYCQYAGSCDVDLHFWSRAADGSFVEQTENPVDEIKVRYWYPLNGSEYLDAHVVDWNSDGLPDVVLMFRFSPYTNSPPHLPYRVYCHTYYQHILLKDLMLNSHMDTFGDINLQNRQPFLLDWNGDGYLDMVVRTTDIWDNRYLRLYESDAHGRSVKEVVSAFENVTCNSEFSRYNCLVSFGDWDGDGDVDVITLTREGQDYHADSYLLHFYERISGGLQEKVYLQRNGAEHVNVHGFLASTPSTSASTRRRRIPALCEFIFGRQAWNFLTAWWGGHRNASIGAVLLQWSCDPWKASRQSWDGQVCPNSCRLDIAQTAAKQHNWNPWNAVRVGEAAHPGPAGTRTSVRKRQERSWTLDETGQGQADDSKLAAALLQVLSAHTGCKQPHTAQEPPRKKGKGIGSQTGQQSRLAQSLLQMLQAAVVHNWSDDQIISKLTAKLDRVAHDNSTKPSQTETRQTKVRRVTFDDTRDFPPLPKSELKARVEFGSKGAKSAAKGNPKPILKKPEVSPETTVRHEKGASRPAASYSQTGLHKDMSRSPQKSRYAVKIIDREWSGDPIITSIPKILDALKEGTKVPGNLIFTGDETVVDEVRQIWAAYDLTDDMTVAVCAPPNSVGPAVSTWWRLDRKNPHPCRYKVNLHQIAEFDGPVPRPPQVVQLLDAAGPKCVTLRLLAPWHYRQIVAGVEALDTPSSIISEWSSLLSEPVATLTGGNWQKLAHPRGPLLVGHIRVPEPFAQKVCSLSGKRGLFATLVTSDRQPVAWCPRPKDVDDQAYFRSTSAEALRRGVSLAFRQGGQSDIGLVGVNPNETRSLRRTAWEVFGAPNHWHQHVIESFLIGEGWTEVVANTKRRLNGQNTWIVHAFCPQEHDAHDGFFQYTNGDNTCHITVSMQGPRKRPALRSEKLVGPRKKWTGAPPPNVMATQLDEDSDMEESHAVSHSAEGIKAAGPSKRTKTGPAARGVDPDSVFLQQHPDWSIIDDQGSGDCGVRSIARSLAVMQDRDLNREQLISEGSRLRTLAVGHLLKNKLDYEPFFAPDPSATDDQRDGHPEPESLSDYVMLAAKKNFWVDGLLLAGLSHRLKRAIVVFSWSAADGAWERHVLAKKN
eukprot:s59_g65.t1